MHLPNLFIIARRRTRPLASERMKIYREHPEQLIVGQNPIMIAVAMSIAGLAFAGAGLSMLLSGEVIGLVFLAGAGVWLLFLFLFVRRVQAIFDAQTGKLTVQSKNLRSSTVVIHDLADVVDAELQSTRSSEGQKLYRVVLSLRGESAGEHPLTEAYSNSKGHHKVAAAITAWLDSYRAQT